MPKSVQGFTLVELLVVIAIMALVGTYTLANYKGFGEGQKVKKASLDIQSLLRQAQTNATSGVKCNQSCVTDCPGTLWQVEFKDAQTVNLSCQDIIDPPPSPTPTPVQIKPLELDTDISVERLSEEVQCPNSVATIQFLPSSGQIYIIDDDGRPYQGCNLLTVILKNNKTNETKSFIIEKGGSIHE